MMFIASYSNGQCTIDDCPSAAAITSGIPFFNEAGIVIPSVKFNNIYCPDGHSGIDVYLYQLLPNGERMENCNVFGDSPDNLVGHTQLYFGAADICIDSVLVVDIEITEDDGFVICDGARYEVVLAMWVDDENDGTYVDGDETPRTVYSVFPNGLNDNYIDYNAGIVEINSIEDGLTYPYIINELTQWGTNISSEIEVQTCEDVELFVAGFSLLANCTPYGDFAGDISSEILNTFSYSINGSPNTLLLDVDLGIGGPVTGNCYGGILSESPTIIPTSNFGLSDGDEMIVSLATTDFFTNESKVNQLTIEFVECEIECLAPNNVNVGSVSDNSATISWSSPQTPDGFLVELRLEDETTWQTYNTQVNFIIFSGLSSCEKYEYRISSTCEGDLFATDIEDFTTVGCPIPCQPLEGLFVNNPTPNSIVLAWDIYPNASYTLYYRMQNDPIWLQDTSTFPLAILVTLEECTDWEWYVVVNCNDGTFSPPSNIQTFSTIGCFRKDNNEQYGAIDIYPNPTKDVLNFELLDNKTDWQTVSITNANGQLMQFNNINSLNNNSLDISELSAGIYFVHFSSTEKIESQKFIVE